MRNLKEYPITDDEVVGFLTELATQFEAEERIGDIRPLLLKYAAFAITGRSVLHTTILDAVNSLEAGVLATKAVRD